LPEGAALRLTTARYYTPDNRSIQALGITPDVEVALTPPGGDKAEKTEKGKQMREADLPQHLPVAAPLAPSPRSGDQSKKNLEDDKQLQTALNILKSLQLYSEKRRN